MGRTGWCWRAWPALRASRGRLDSPEPHLICEPRKPVRYPSVDPAERGREASWGEADAPALDRRRGDDAVAGDLYSTNAAGVKEPTNAKWIPKLLDESLLAAVPHTHGK